MLVCAFNGGAMLILAALLPMPASVIKDGALLSNDSVNVSPVVLLALTWIVCTSPAFTVISLMGLITGASGLVTVILKVVLLVSLEVSPVAITVIGKVAALLDNCGAMTILRALLILVSETNEGVSAPSEIDNGSPTLVSAITAMVFV